VSNPFEDIDGRYQVLVNSEGQHSLWPTSVRIPDGWTVAHGTDSRSNCIGYIEANWTDMRPQSLIQSGNS